MVELENDNKETILKMYFVDKLRPVDIAKNLGISKSAVSQCLKNDDRYTKEKEKRIFFYKKKQKNNWPKRLIVLKYKN